MATNKPVYREADVLTGQGLRAVIFEQLLIALGDGTRRMQTSTFANHLELSFKATSYGHRPGSSLTSMYGVANWRQAVEPPSIYWLSQYVPSFDRSGKPFDDYELLAITLDFPVRWKTPDSECFNGRFEGWREYLGSELWVKHCREIFAQISLKAPSLGGVLDSALLSKIIKESCQIRGFTFEELCLMAGVSPKAITSILDGQTNEYSTKQLDLLSKVLFDPTKKDTVIGTFDALLELTRKKSYLLDTNESSTPEPKPESAESKAAGKVRKTPTAKAATRPVGRPRRQTK